MAADASSRDSRFVDPFRLPDSELEPLVDRPGVPPPGREVVRRINGAPVSRSRTDGSDGRGSPAFDRHAKAPPAWEVLENGRATLDEMCRSWSLPALGWAKLLEVLDTDPVSRVRATPRSVAVHVPSAKMGRVIQAASRTVEFAFVHYCEYDPEVLLYADQPLTVPIRIVDSLNRSRSVSYTCDYLVLRSDGVYVYECKPLDWLHAQSQKPNSRYVYDPSASAWRHPAAEEAFRPYGFSHRVFHSGDVDSLWLRNVRYLADFLSADPPAGVDEALTALRRAKSLTFSDACRVPGTSRESWYWLIASGAAAFDLERDPLDRPDLLAIASVHHAHAAMLCHRCALDSRADAGVVPSLSHSAVLSLDPGDCVLFRDARHQVVLRDANQVVLSPIEGYSQVDSTLPVVIPLDGVSAFLDSGDLRAVAPQPHELVAQHSRRLLVSVTDAERARALRRWSAVCHYSSVGCVPPGVSRSALFNYLSWARQASVRYGSEFLGMFRRCDGSSGVRRASPEQLALLREVAEAFHRGKYSSRVDAHGSELLLPSRRRFPAAYADYLRLSRERGLAPRSSRMLRRELKSHSLEQSELARRGSRAAYPHSPPQARLSGTLPAHGARVFEVGHVDHQLLDVWCVSGATGAVLGRPWLTLVFDAFSRMPLGFTVRFDAPCVYSVLCAIYNCVSRYGRFVNALVSDQGSEFESPDLGVALAYLRAAHMRRPPTKPRFGALIERQFGSLKTRLVDELSGSIDTVARSRELTSTHDPQRHALWTLPSLSKLIEEYFFERYPLLVHGELGAAPRSVFEYSMEQAGERVARHVPLDETLSLALSETVPGSNGTRTVPKGGGPIRTGYLNFHHPDFSDGRVAGRPVPVRRCPADASYVYVLLPHRGVWVRARLVSGSIDLTHCSWRQARALIEESARQRLIASRASTEEANALVMSELLLSIDDYEREALDRRRTIDTEQQLESFERSGVEPEPASGSEAPHPLPPSDLSPPVPGSVSPSLNPTLLRSYDEQPA